MIYSASGEHGNNMNRLESFLTNKIMRLYRLVLVFIVSVCNAMLMFFLVQAWRLDAIQTAEDFGWWIVIFAEILLGLSCIFDNLKK